MKVLLCSPLRGKIGGISLWTKHITDYFSENNKNIRVELFDTARNFDVYPNTPIIERAGKGIKDYRSILGGIENTLKKGKYDLLHLVSSGSFSLVKDLFVLRAAKKRKVKTAIHFHFGRIPDVLKKNNWETKLFKRVVAKADKIIVIDSLSYESLKKKGFNNVYLIPNPLSPEIVKIISDNSGIIRDRNKIMFAGHVIPSKGIFELIEATKDRENVEVIILGAIQNEMLAELQSKIGSSSAKFNIAGEVTHEQIIKEMLSSFIFVLPSYTEGFPNVILESMASGCCIISTNVGAIPEMLDSDKSSACGITVEPKNSAQLSEAISLIFKDEKISEALQKNAVKKVNKAYNIEIVSNELENIWKS